MDGQVNMWAILMGGVLLNIIGFLVLVMVVAERRSMYVHTDISCLMKIAAVVAIFIPFSYIAIPAMALAVAGLYSLGVAICDFFFE